MTPYDRQRLFSALVLLVTALFVAGGAAPIGRWQRRLRLAALAGLILGVVAALVEIALWLSRRGG
jgi:hypothetical protein